MKLISIASISLLLSAFQMHGQPGVEQHLLSNVNPHWMQVSLTHEQAERVRQCGTYHECIQLHLELVSETLKDRTASMALDEPTRQMRLALLDSLTAYHKRSVFPINNKAPYSTPVFVDDAGTHCAVGYLLHASGYDGVVSQIAKESYLAYVQDLQYLYPVLSHWAGQHGFTIQELAWIQPLYQFFCNEGIAPGEIIHNTCYGECTGAFYADHTTIDLPPDLVLSWGYTYKWHNGQWVIISHPDCLCPGLYRQAFDVHSPLGDSLYSVFIEAEILSPEELWGYEGIDGEAGLCRAYIMPEAWGGVPPYTFEAYDMEGNAYGLGPLCEGEYYLVTEDAHGCQVEENVQVYTPEADCLAFSVTDMQFDGPLPGNLHVTIFLEGDSSSFITIPYYAEVKNQEGDVLAWSGDTLTQFGGTSHTYEFETTSVPFPTNASLTMELGFNYSFCEIPYDYTTTSTWDLQGLSMSLYPNPLYAESTLMINEVHSDCSLQIFNVHGQLVRTWTVNESDAITIERGNLSQGFYTLQVVTGGKTSVERFVIVD